MGRTVVGDTMREDLAMRLPFGIDLPWLIAIALAGVLLGVAAGGTVGGSRVAASAAAPDAAPGAAPAPTAAGGTAPAAGTVTSADAFTLVAPAAGSCVLDPAIAVRGVARVPPGAVHIALLRGATVLGSTDVVVEQAGPVAATLDFDPHSLVGMVRLVVTGGSGPGGPLLASRAFGLCTTWA